MHSDGTNRERIAATGNYPTREFIQVKTQRKFWVVINFSMNQPNKNYRTTRTQSWRGTTKSFYSKTKKKRRRSEQHKEFHHCKFSSTDGIIERNATTNSCCACACCASFIQIIFRLSLFCCYRPSLPFCSILQFILRRTKSKIIHVSVASGQPNTIEMNWMKNKFFRWRLTQFEIRSAQCPSTAPTTPRWWNVGNLSMGCDWKRGKMEVIPRVARKYVIDFNNDDDEDDKNAQKFIAAAAWCTAVRRICQSLSLS